MFSKTKYRQDIQVLRGIAVLAVVLFHCNEDYFPLGYLGVDTFFVISGFVVTPLILQIFADQTNDGIRLTKLIHFYNRRFYRLAPALVLTLGVSAILFFLLGPIGDHRRIASQGIATLLLIGNIGAYRYSGDYFSPNPNPLVHTWSLSIEEQIYIFLPLGLMMIIRNRKNFKELTTFLFLTISVISFILFIFPATLDPLYSHAGIESTTQFSFYSPIERIWQFTVGGLAFLFLDKDHRFTRSIPKKINLLFVLASFIVLFGPMNLNPKVTSTLMSLSTILLITFKSVDDLPSFLIQMLKWVGDRSYSIYLVHLPLLYIAKYSPLTKIGLDEERNFESALAVVLSILLGALSYSKIESKYRNIYTADLPSAKRIAVSMVITLIIPIITFVSLDRSAALGLKNSGLPVPSKVVPWNWDKQCQILSSQSNIKLEPCEYGNHKSGKSIFLIGDSHAASASRAIISLGNSYNMDTFVFTYSGCGFVLSKSEFNSSYSYPYLTSDCIQHNQSILNIIKHIRPTVIIYATRSSSIMVTPNNSRSRAQYNEMVKKNLKVLMKQNIEVIHIGSVPELLPVISRLQDWKNYKPKFSDIPFEDNDYWKKNYESSYYLDSMKVFCPKKVCSNKSSNGWLFYDADHLSELGANRLLTELDQIIEEILVEKH